MTPRERVRIAMEGGRPDRVPVVPIYDVGYLMRAIGHDPREWAVAGTADKVRFVDEGFLRHDVDGYFVHDGTANDWVAANGVEKGDRFWRVTDRDGKVFRLMPDGNWTQADGSPVPRASAEGGESLIRTDADLDARVPAAPTEAEVERSGRYEPLRNLTGRYPDHHFSFQMGSPMVSAIGACGGYAEGLTLMATDRDLFCRIQARYVEYQVARLGPARRAGGHSAWFTSYYTGADTISPRDYAEVVFPYEKAVCQACRDAGFFVLNWFLGDLMPILDKVMELPLDALVLEQGRKGYDIDPVAIRRRVGPRFCLFGFGYERDYCTFDRAGLTRELERQVRGAGMDGAFIAGTPIMPPDANPAAVDHYFAEARRLS